MYGVDFDEKDIKLKSAPNEPSSKVVSLVMKMGFKTQKQAEVFVWIVSILIIVLAGILFAIGYLKRETVIEEIPSESFPVLVSRL